MANLRKRVAERSRSTEKSYPRNKFPRRLSLFPFLDYFSKHKRVGQGPSSTKAQTTRIDGVVATNVDFRVGTGTSARRSPPRFYLFEGVVVDRRTRLEIESRLLGESTKSFHLFFFFAAKRKSHDPSRTRVVHVLHCTCESLKCLFVVLRNFMRL